MVHEPGESEPFPRDEKMRASLHVGCAIAVVLVGSHASARSVVAQTTSELDAYWAEVSRTVEGGDFDGYAALYHEDAVLVSSAGSQPIATALEDWKQGFTDTKSGKNRSSVEFRFSQRLNDGTTAHESGIFRFSLRTASGEVTIGYTRFEALLVRKNGWKMVMEYQRSETTADDWNSLN